MELEHECPACGHGETRRLFNPRIHIHGAKVESAEYNPGLGCVVRNKAHREELCKQKGLIEVGNETPAVIERETVIRREKEREQEWKDL